MIQRQRRLRNNKISREMVAETRLSESMFIYPYFVLPGKGITQPIEAMPGINRFSPDMLVKDVEQGLKSGVNKLLLFGVGEEKHEDAHSSYNENSVVAESVRMLKKQFGADLMISTDVCLCAYTTHGHCGVMKNDEIQNDRSIEILAKMALAHAQAGADMVAPSDMMDGRVGAIREMLDGNGFEMTPVMSYASKFASSYYGPFREAADSSPGKGDRKGYQMDFRNSREAIREALIDEAEGADILMVKPALAYLDVLYRLRQETLLPLACYNVSAEYSMVKMAGSAGLIDERSIIMENMHAYARAGADVIISYHAREILEKGWLR